MAIAGNLRTMVLSELLQWLSLAGKTGTLRVRSGEIEKRIYFRQGRIASTSSSERREFLGHFLVSHGYITEEELKMAMEIQEESSILLGKILVMINAISETDLIALIRRKAEESIYEIFLWEEGEFEFVDHEIPDQSMIPLSVDVTGIVLEGFRRYDEWKEILGRLGSLDVVPAIVRPMPIERYSDRQKLVVPYVDGRRSIVEIAVQTHNSDYFVARLVFDAVQEGTMEIRERPLPDPRAAPPGVGDDMDHLLRRGRMLQADDPAAAWRVFHAACELDPADGRPRDALREVEVALRLGFEGEGLLPTRVPFLRLAESDLTRLTCTPNEGFVLSRINGSWDVRSILRISPMREIEVLLALRRFLAEGVIGWKA
jgi:hypothetical protein